MRLLISDMSKVLKTYWDEAAGYQKVAAYFGVLMFLSGLFHVVVLIAEGGSWYGDISWRKPILFGIGLGINALCFAWITHYLPKKQWQGWVVIGLLLVGSIGDLVLIDLQQWRGVASHFNNATEFDSLVFGGMGISVAFLSSAVVMLTIWTFFPMNAPGSMVWAIRIGMLLLVASQFFGQLIINHGVEVMQAGSDQPVNVYGAAGDLKRPHALSQHGIQVLPLLAWLMMFTNIAERLQRNVVLLAGISYTTLVVISTFQTYSGLKQLDMGAVSMILMLLSVASLLFAFAFATLGLVKRHNLLKE